MQIEIWSDFICPFCYIGKRRFDAALESFQERDQINVTYKSYQLDPNTPAYHGQSYVESLAKKFGSTEQAKQMTEDIQKQAKTVGMEFDFDQAKPANTLDAHRLNQLAKQEQVQEKLSELLFQAHFVDGKDIGDKEVLLNIAQDVGLDTEKVKHLLEDASVYQEEVKTDLQEATEFGISGVPYFIVNRKYAISGAQPVAAFTQALEQVWQEENQNKPLQDITADHLSGDACGADGCEVPEEEN